MGGSVCRGILVTALPPSEGIWVMKVKAPGLGEGYWINSGESL